MWLGNQEVQTLHRNFHQSCKILRVSSPTSVAKEQTKTCAPETMARKPATQNTRGPAALVVAPGPEPRSLSLRRNKCGGCATVCGGPGERCHGASVWARGNYSCFVHWTDAAAACALPVGGLGPGPDRPGFTVRAAPIPGRHPTLRLPVTVMLARGPEP